MASAARSSFFVAAAFAACVLGPSLGCAKGSSAPDSPKIAARARVIREPAVVRSEGNALAASASAYLREHGHDPVDWRPWNDETLALAAAEDKPIFLSIGYSSCHFCHVMHDEVFAKDDVARVLNERFIAIKVDREERPDLDATYMAALSRFSGSTGWPATLFLTSTLDPFFGATYVRHDRFLEVAQNAAALYERRDAGATWNPVHITDVLGDGALTRGTQLTPAEIRAFAADAPSEMDPLLGGFGHGAKFPMPPRLRFLLHASRKWGLTAVDDALNVTLAAMSQSSLRDPISGAFHRYTTDAAWTTPHYEVMLYDVAQLASVYFEAARAMRAPDATHPHGDYEQVGRGILDFLLRDMRVDGGAFAASLDADTDGEEGAAFRWSKSEVVAVAGPTDGPLVAAVLGVGAEKIAPSRRTSFADVASAAHVSEQDVSLAWERARPTLLASRVGLTRRDSKIVTAWNGLAVDALCLGFMATKDARYRDAAVSVGEAISLRARDGNGMLTRTPGGVAAFSADYGDLANAYLSLFEITSDLRWLTRADGLLEEARALEMGNGGFFEGRENLARSVIVDDGVEPSGTAAMLGALLHRIRLSPNETWSAPIARAISKYGNTLRARKLDASGWLDAALIESGPSYEVVIAGTPEDAAPLLEAQRAFLPSWTSVTLVPAEGADASWRAALPSLEAKTAAPETPARGSAGGRARAFVCERAACKAPTNAPRILREQLLTGWDH